MAHVYIEHFVWARAQGQAHCGAARARTTRHLQLAHGPGLWAPSLNEMAGVFLNEQLYPWLYGLCSGDPDMLLFI